MMIRSTTLRAVLTALTLSAPLSAQDASEADVAVLRETIAQVIDVKSQTSQEKALWEQEKASMAALLDLHRQELALLNEELATAGQSAGDYDAEQQQRQARVEQLKEARAAAAETVAANRTRTLALAKRFPPPLLNAAEADIIELEEWKKGDEPRQGLQAILRLVTQAAQFNRRLTREKEERGGRQVDVIYLGLAAAYYADANGSAGVGKPGPEGWKWQQQDDVHSAVTLVLAQLDKKRPPERVRLPIEISTPAAQ